MSIGIRKLKNLIAGAKGFGFTGNEDSNPFVQILLIIFKGELLVSGRIFLLGVHWMITTTHHATPLPLRLVLETPIYLHRHIMVFCIF